MITKRKKANAIKEARIHDTDTGSADVQIAILTKRISELTTYLKANKKDNHSRKGLIQMVADRRSHIKYLARTNPKRHKSLLEKLGLRG